VLKNKIVQVLIALLVFIIAAMTYFSPVLEGKKLFQSDIAQFRGISKEIVDYRSIHHQEPYWTNRVFGGMPAYNISAYYPYNFIKKMDIFIRFLPHPADYLFLYFMGFFILLYVLKVDWKLCILGALAFGFSTYLIIIFGAGHNAKAHAIAFMPVVLAGIVSVFKRNYLFGFILSFFGLAFEINAGHPQMTYYLLFAVMIFGLIYLIDAVKNKTTPHFFKSILILVVGLVLAVGVNSTNLFATQNYAKQSTRSKSELTVTPDGKKKQEITSGLSKDYITQYSYSIPETFDLLIPRFLGGGSRENLGKDSKSYNFLKDKIGRIQAKNYSENLPMYWGAQPIVEAPAYIGSVLIFLFVLGLFTLKGKIKNWLISITIFSILLSWGKNFGLLTDFFIDYVPFYNKFRAVSSIQVLAELAIPLMGILALDQFIRGGNERENKLKFIKKSLFIVGGITLFFTLFGTNFFGFESFRDTNLKAFENQFPGFIDAIRADRKMIFFRDSLRSLILVVLSAAVLWAFLKKMIKKNILILVFAVLILFDLVAIDKRYVNNEDFVSKVQVEKPFQASDIDQEILKDKSHYRVINFMVDPMNDGSTSYFHNSIGGYHAAKPRRYQELYDYQIAKNNIEVLNMLNTKYIIYPTNDGKAALQINNDANGNAWFVENVRMVHSADEEISALDSLSTKTEVVVNDEFKDQLTKLQFKRDSLAIINLQSYQPNELIYESKSDSQQLAVFSEMYFKDGWHVYLDGKESSYFRANYVLRAMVLPTGKHEIVFKFEPEIIETGNTITLASYVLLIMIPLAWFFNDKRKLKNEPS
jgi:hypothetical protein